MNVLLCISTGLAAGLAIGGIIGAWSINAKWEKLFALYNLSTASGVLEAMRSEKMTHAIDMIEGMLDVGIIGVGRQLSSLSPKQRDSTDVDWLRRAREYRAKYPRALGQPNVDLAITKAFAVLD